MSRRPTDSAWTQWSTAATVFASVAAAAILVHASQALFGWASGAAADLIDDWLYCGLFGLVSVACALRARHDELHRTAWWLASAGVLVWGAAEVVYRLLRSDPTATYPTATRALLVLAFTIAGTTVALLGRARIERVRATLLVDGLVGGLAVAALAAAFLFAEPVGGHAQPGPPALFLVADLAILAFVVITTALTGWRPGRCWALIGAGIVVNTAGNAALVAETGAGSFHRGAIVDTLFIGSALLLGTAAWSPLTRAAARLEDGRTLLWPSVLALVAVGILLVGALTSVPDIAVVLAAATLLALVVRTLMAFEENRRLLEASRHEALTDALTGLLNRRCLTADLAAAARAASPRRPLTLATFDLDGFKDYNDTFGHPAGDALLARVAQRFAAALGDARAYRSGGDEFCALIRLDRINATAAVRLAAAALGEQGEAFSVTASHGAVGLPEEAADPEVAMQLADRRMYAHKDRRRTSAGQQTRSVLVQILAEQGPDLGGRDEEVTLLATDVGRRMAMGEEDLDLLTRAAELRDVGNVAVPQEILDKPGPLDADEERYVRQHTLIGERILKAAPALAPAAALVRASHEHFDGSGYPDELARGDIPLGARIIAVCDAFAAMTTWRPHNLVRTPRQALDELHRRAGSQFDPAVVDAFIVAWQERAGLRRHSADRDRMVHKLRRAVADGLYEVEPERVAAAVLQAPARSKAGPRILRRRRAS